MNELFLEEHREALQEDLNKRSEAFMKTLNEKDRKKFEAVTEAFNVLRAADVRAYIFPMLKYPGCQEEKCYQFNNHVEYLKFENGKQTEESLQESSDTNRAFMYIFLTWLYSIKELKSINEAINMFLFNIDYYIKNQLNK